MMAIVFNLIGRIISTTLGLVVLCLGVVWILQAFDVAFDTPRVPAAESWDITRASKRSSYTVCRTRPIARAPARFRLRRKRLPRLP